MTEDEQLGWYHIGHLCNSPLSLEHLHVPNTNGSVHLVDTATLTEIIPPIVLPFGSSAQGQVTVSDGYIVVSNLPGAFFVPAIAGKGVFVYKLNP